MTETWYVLEDGSFAHPREVSQDANGVYRHKSGRAVAMRGDVPRSRSVDPAKEAEKAKPKPIDNEARDLKPEQPKRTYKTRESKAD